MSDAGKAVDADAWKRKTPSWIIGKMRQATFHNIAEKLGYDVVIDFRGDGMNIPLGDFWGGIVVRDDLHPYLQNAVAYRVAATHETPIRLRTRDAARISRDWEQFYAEDVTSYGEARGEC